MTHGHSHDWLSETFEESLHEDIMKFITAVAIVLTATDVVILVFVR